MLSKKLLSMSLIPVSVVVFAFSAKAADDEGLKRGESVFERERPDYTSKGPKIGSFFVKPELGLSYNYDSNIFKTQSNETDDNITVVKPGLKIRSDWGRHALGIYASGDIGTFTENDRENYQDYSVGFDGRLDVLRETYLTGGVNFSQKHEDRGSPDNAGGVEPTDYTLLTSRLGLMRGISRVSVKLDGEHNLYNYDDAYTGAGVAIDNDDRDRAELSGSLRVGYELAPEYEAFVKATLTDIDYNSNVEGRDSSGYNLVAGTALDFSGKLKGEIYAGYLNFTYDSPRLPDIESATFGGNLTWNITSLTSIKPAVDRSVQQTTTANSSGFIATNYSLNIEHELRRNILLGANYKLGKNEYQGGTPEREDDLNTAGAGVQYLINKKASVKVDYQYEERDSNLVNQDYTDNKVMLNFNLSL